MKLNTKGLVFPFKSVDFNYHFNRVSVFIEFAFSTISFFSKPFNLIIIDGTAGRFNKPGIHGEAFIDGKTLLFKLPEKLRIDLIHDIFRQTASKARQNGMIVRGSV